MDAIQTTLLYIRIEWSVVIIVYDANWYVVPTVAFVKHLCHVLLANFMIQTIQI
jgi:hypothetical protein